MKKRREPVEISIVSTKGMKNSDELKLKMRCDSLGRYLGDAVQCATTGEVTQIVRVSVLALHGLGPGR